MIKFIGSRVWRLGIALILVLTLCGLTVSAQEPDTEGAGTAEAGAPTYTELELLAEPPVLTEEQKAQMEYYVEHTHMPGPMLSEEHAMAATGPEPGTESRAAEERPRSGQPLAPGDNAVFWTKGLGDILPAGYGSNAMGSSVGQGGKFSWFTGNWFAAYTKKGGRIWSFVDPFSEFPGLCYDQISIYDEARDIYLWLRTGIPDENGENVFKLSVAKYDPVTWWTYTFAPTVIDPSWTHQRWDHPHIQLGADYAYITWNVLDWNGTSDPSDDFWTRSVMLRLPLDDLAAFAPTITYMYYWNSEWFTFMPVQGAYHTMYWASNWPKTTTPQNSRIHIWKWQEDEDYNGIVSWVVDIFAWKLTDEGDAHCPLTGDYNWLARADQRILTGARYSINVPGLEQPKILGRKVLGWWWNVGEGEGFLLPYIEGVAFFEDSLNVGPPVQLPGWLGRPYQWTYLHCFAYPSMTPNKRQDLGAIFHYAEEPDWAPNIAYAMADDYTWAPPGWVFYLEKASNALPADNTWGPWNTLREFEPSQKLWVAASHFIKLKTPCVDCGYPRFFYFGRERDRQAWKRWWRR